MKKPTIQERRAKLNKKLEKRAKRKKMIENILAYIGLWIVFGGLYIIAEIVY